MHYLLLYEYAADYLERRGQFRPAHLKLAWASHDRGELILGGAFQDPSDMGVLFFRAESPAIVEAFAREDPYVLNGVVKNWRVRPWLTVVGDTAFSPVRPD
jgi:uncharacterized protein YciI